MCLTKHQTIWYGTKLTKSMHLKIRKSAVVLLFVAFSSLYGQSHQHQILLPQEKIVCYTEQNRLNGTYKSYHSNGQLKACGVLKNGLRIGEWSVYDSTGNLKHQREYKDLYDYQLRFPKASSATIIGAGSGVSTPFYDTHKGYKEFKQVADSSLYWVTNLYWELEAENNELLFQNDLLAKTLLTNIYDGHIKEVYQEPGFKNSWDKSTILKPQDVIGFRVKEGWYYIQPHGLFQHYIRAIALVGKDANGDKKELCWIWYPDCRAALSQVNVRSGEKSMSLDDLLFDRMFSASIFKDENLYLNQNDFYSKDPEQKGLEKLAAILENEHNFWLGSLYGTY